MAKLPLDAIDKGALAEAAAVLGTRTPEGTVAAALREIVECREPGRAVAGVPEDLPADTALIRMWHKGDAPDGPRAELLDGEIVPRPTPGHFHDLPGRTFVRHTPEPFEAWNGRGLLVADDYRPRADAVVIRSADRPAGNEADWPARIVLAVVETVSTTRTAIRRDREDKRERYAQVGIPVYVIVDPNDATWHVLRLDGRHYVETAKGVFGQDIPMPEPMRFTVRTAGWHPYGGKAA
ncbi:Uma2 family endonuclease [Streptomyces sp. NPDC003077]|uniref:Uma2 family endonuclease n=1 Tax=Streptomyces sp. NPDC003077 TaxID=3154443 RepID=UPI0033AF4DB5